MGNKKTLKVKKGEGKKQDSQRKVASKQGKLSKKQEEIEEIDENEIEEKSTKPKGNKIKSN